MSDSSRAQSTTIKARRHITTACHACREDKIKVPPDLDLLLDGPYQNSREDEFHDDFLTVSLTTV